MCFSDKINYYLYWSFKERVTNSFLAVATEIQRRLDGWKLKLEEIEKKYSELGSVLVYRYTRTDTIDPTICNS